MDAVIVMVGRSTEPNIYDIEIMPDVPASELSESIAQAFHWAGTYDIKIASTNLKLSPTQTLADVGAWDGTHICLVPSPRLQSQNKQVLVDSSLEQPKAAQTGMHVLKTPDHLSGESNLEPNENKRPTPVSNWKQIEASIDPTEQSDDNGVNPVKGWRKAGHAFQTQEESD